MKKLTLIITILLLGQITAKTIIVDLDGSGDYLTINEGINATTANGDTVLVMPGVYIEGVKLSGGVGIYLIGSGAEVTTVFYAGTALTANSSGHEISGFNIQSTQARAVQLNGNVKLKNCIIQGYGERNGNYNSSYPAIYYYSKGNVIVNTVIQNSGYGIYGHDGEAEAVVTNCIFYNNQYGITINYSTMTIQNTIFYSNSFAVQKENSNNGFLSTLYSCFSSNDNNWGGGTVAGIGDLISDPKFENISESFSLQSDSPARDAGNPSNIFNDGDGSRNDMGVYGGPSSWGKGPVITEINITPDKINQGGTVTMTATAKKN